MWVVLKKSPQSGIFGLKYVTQQYMAQRRLEIEVQFPGYFFRNRLQKKYCKIEVNTQKKFWSQKVVSNVNQSLFEPQYEPTKCDWQFLLAPGLTINIKKKSPFLF